MATKVEFAVEMTCEKCVNQIENSLGELKGIDNVDISLERGTVVLETNLPYSVIQEKIEDSGRKAVLKGFGDNTTSAVVMLGGGICGFGIDDTKGVVRFVQTDDGCIVDGTIDGLTPGAHGLHVHECGDISNGCESVGEHFNPFNSNHGGRDNDIQHRLLEPDGICEFIPKMGTIKIYEANSVTHVGDLGNVVANNLGRATFRFQDKLLTISDIIGRSLVVTQDADDLGRGNDTSKIDGNSGPRIACGIIARSSGIFENVKKICACDGKTLWEEREELKKKVNGNKL